MLKNLFIVTATIFSVGFNHGMLKGAQSQEIPDRPRLKEVTFRFQPIIGGVDAVYLGGTFNDWSKTRHRMTDADGDGIYSITLLLPDGRYEYKFFVDGRWITDPDAGEYSGGSREGANAVIRVDGRFTVVELLKGDGRITSSGIPHRLDYTMVNPIPGTGIEFRTRTLMNDVSNVFLLVSIDGEQEAEFEMEPVETDLKYQNYRKMIDIPLEASVAFTFRFDDGAARVYATRAGIVEDKPAMRDGFLYTERILPPFITPDWAKDGIFYQIFTDRFFNGDRSNDQDFKEVYYEGKSILPPEGKTNDEYFHFIDDWQDIGGLVVSPYRTDGRPDYYSFYGGDIAGVMQKLPYLKDLGITIIYFNPLNEAQSNHKYDPVDYNTIDPHFADEETFKAFTKKAHEYGIRIIADMAFNHTGYWHFAFVDTREKGADSKYWHWFEWKKWPLPPEGPPTPCDYYDCWWGYPAHPNLNYDHSRPNDQENMIDDASLATPNQQVVDYILEVARFWLGELDIDGFRLDVPNEVPLWMWAMFRRVVDQIKPEAFLVGEIWGNAMPWLGPDCFHATMNYRFFRDPVVKFIGLGQGTASEFDRELAPGRSLYPRQATQVMMNIVGSHDTERFITTAKNDERRLMLSALFQMTYLGIPHIYYGDEVGLEGGKDPDNRRTFPWEWRQNNRRSRIHDFYRSLISIRKSYPALRAGSFRSVLTEGKVFGYLREDANQRLLVVLNNETADEKIRIPVVDWGFPGKSLLRDLLTNQDHRTKNGMLSLKLEPLSGVILIEKFD